MVPRDVTTPQEHEAANQLRRLQASVPLSRREGLEAGRVLGREEGYAEGLRSSIRSLCQALGIELDQQGEAKLVGLGIADLESLRDTLIADRRRPG